MLERQGTPSALSRSHHAWPIIDDAVAATRMVLPTRKEYFDRPESAVPLLTLGAPDADSRVLFHQRRSAVSMDGQTGLELVQFLSTLARAVHPTSPPLMALPWRSRIHLLLFVHRVTGLTPGIYCLIRGGQEKNWLQSRMREDFLWEKPDRMPFDLPFYLLVPIDCRDLARRVCCHQDIAADSTFAVAMLAEFAPSLQMIGPVAWRLLHAEAGAIGQLLYLEAEAHGLRATGIGCFFDPEVHQLLGLTNDDLRTVYHFTTGGAVEDERLQTLAPYPDQR